MTATRTRVEEVAAGGSTLPRHARCSPIRIRSWPAAEGSGGSRRPTGIGRAGGYGVAGNRTD